MRGIAHCVCALAVVVGGPGSALADEPCQLQRLLAPGPYASTSFGNAVARSGEYWFVADYRAEVLCTGFGCGAGAVYVYQMIDGQLEHVQTLTSPFPQSPDNYGISIDADDVHLVVGAPFSGLPGRSDRPGAVFVYRLSDGSWAESARIEPPAEALEFGTEVAVDNGQLLVSENYNDRLGRLPRVLAYEARGSNWELRDIVSRPDDVSENSWFGIALSLSNERLVVGAPFDRAERTNGGSVHVYRRSVDGTYELEQSLRVDAAERIGRSISISGSRLLAGAPLATRDFEFQGVVYEYEFDGSQWVQSAEIRSNEPDQQDTFGTTVTLEGNQLFVTAEGDSVGSVQAFGRSADGDWQQQSRIVPDTTTLALRFGWSMATDGRFLLVGAPEESDVFSSDDYGAAYFFDLACTDCQPDLDLDGSLTIYDFLTFLNLF
ncbi:MAG: FG-GAP repeat protein [Phycisphaerales bacterium]